MQNKTFKFYIPEAIIEKSGKNSQGEETMIVSGICSTDDEDSDGENLEPIGFDLEPLIKKGFINWNHQAKKDPNAIIGEPIEAKVVEGNKLFVKAMLYSNSTLAKSVYNKIDELEKSGATRRIGWSIEGIPILRDKVNKKRILKASITGIALTHCPKNPNTLAQVIKGEVDEDEDEIETEHNTEDKSMNVDINLNPESVEGFSKEKNEEDKDDENKEKNRKNKKLFSKSRILSIFIKKLQGEDIELVKSAFNTFEQKIYPEMANSNELTVDSIEKAANDFCAFLKGETSEIEKSEKIEEIEKSEDISDVNLILAEAKGIYAQMKVSSPDFSFDELTESLIRNGYSLSESANTAQQVIDEFEKNNNGGEVTAVQPSDVNEGLAKSIDEKLDSFTKSFDEKLQMLVNTVIQPLIKQSKESDEVIKSLNDSFEKSQQQSFGRKSVTSAVGAIPVERFAKSEESDRQLSLHQRKEIIEKAHSQSPNETFLDAMLELEGSGGLLSNETSAKLSRLGVRI